MALECQTIVVQSTYQEKEVHGMATTIASIANVQEEMMNLADLVDGLQDFIEDECHACGLVENSSNAHLCGACPTGKAWAKVVEIQSTLNK